MLANPIWGKKNIGNPAEMEYSGEGGRVRYQQYCRLNAFEAYKPRNGATTRELIHIERPITKGLKNPHLKATKKEEKSIAIR